MLGNGLKTQRRKHTPAVRLREGLGLGQERPHPAPWPPRRPPPAAATQRLQGNSRKSARAILGQGSARRALLPWKPLCAHAHKWGVRRRTLLRALTAGGGVYPSPRPALPSGGTRAPPTSLGRSVSSSTRPARVLPHPLPLPLPHTCSPPAFVRRCSRRWEHPGISAAERRSGRRRRRPKSFYSWDDAGGRRRGDEALSQSRSGVGPERGGAGSFLAAGGGTGAGLFALLAHSPHQLGLRRCICIRSLPELSTLETTATPWAASRMSLSR